MKKFLITLFLFACLTGTAHALVYGLDFYLENKRTFFSGTSNDPMYRHLAEVDGVLAGGDIGDASIWYVNSNVSTEGDGTSWTNARDTLQEAIDLASAGDFVDVAEGHYESGTDPNLWEADVNGLTIRHYGNEARQGRYNFADTDTTIKISAANVKVYGGRYEAGIDAVVMGFDVAANADGFKLIGARFPEPTTSSWEFVRAIVSTTGADRVGIIGCDYANVGATGATNFIDLDTGIVDEMDIIGNRIKGEFAEGAIHSDKACTSMWIEGNAVTNITSGEHGIEFTTAATGVLKDNVVSTNAIGNSYDVGSLEELGANLWDDYGTQDTSPVPWTTNETGVDRWGASELAQIKAEVEGALAVELLEKFLANADGGSNAYPDSVVAQSMLAFLMCTGANPAITTYDNTTMSLQALNVDLDALIAAQVSAADVSAHDANVIARLDILEAAALPSYSHQNYFTVDANMRQATWNTVDAHEIAEVTGAVRMTIMAECTLENIVTASTNGTIALGYAGNTAAIWLAAALDTWDLTEVAMGITAGVPTFPIGGGDAGSALTHVLFDIVAASGIDVGYTIATNAGEQGIVRWHIWWTPLDSTGAVVAGGGGGF